MAEDELHRYPSDIGTQGSQEPITLHSEETPATSDRVVVVVRRMLRTMVDGVEAGKDPLGVSRADGPPRRVESGVFTVSTGSGTASVGATAADPAAAGT